MVLGVNGVTGRAIASELLAAGWSVVGTGRDAKRLSPLLRSRGMRFVIADRHDPTQLHQVLDAGADVVVDCLCYTAEHAQQLLAFRGSFGSAVVLSSKAVYVDDHGRHTNSEQPPRFSGPVTEQQSVLEPDFSGAFDSREGYGPNKVAAEVMLLESAAPVSILRPSRVHGPGGARPREWFVVRRLLDGRNRIPLAHQGRCANHPTAAENLARLVTTCARQPGRRVLNSADPDMPTASDVVRAIAAAARQDVEIVGLDHDAPSELGWTPWETWPPLFLDTTASTALGYKPAGSYAQTVVASVQWLLQLEPEQRTRLDRDAYFAGRFDYGRDDAALL